MISSPNKEITLLSLILAGFLFLLPLAKAFSIHSTLLDLGIFESLLYRIAVGNEWQQFFFGHAQWFALPYGWLYGVFPVGLAPYFLIGIQSILLLLPAIWFHSRFGVFAAFAYVSYYPLWANAHFDFHFDHLAVPLLLGFYWALLDRRIGWAVLSGTLLMFVKEPFALQTIGCGLLLLWAAFHRKSIWEQLTDQVSQGWLAIGGLWLIFAGMGYFYFLTKYVFSYFSLDGVGLNISIGPFGWLGSNPWEIIQTIFTTPHVIIWDIITTPSKLMYLSIIFNLLASISLLRPVFLIPTLPLLAISMLSHLPNFYNASNHYTAGLIIPVMIAFVHGLPRAEKIWEWILMWMSKRLGTVKMVLPSNIVDSSSFQPSSVEKNRGLLRPVGKAFSTAKGRQQIFYLLLFSWILAGHIWLSPSPISRLFWSDQVWSYNWRIYIPTERDEMMKVAMKKYIPADYYVSVTTQNSVNWGHLAHRQIYLPFPLNITEPHEMMDWSNRTLKGFWEFVRTGIKPPDIMLDKYADYVVLDMKRPYFLVDKGCNWVDGKCRNNKTMEKKFLEWVDLMRSLYDTVFEKDGFTILQRREL
jgi:uncharacterized membrane protein